MYTAGGAIFVNLSTVLIDRCQFMDNQAHLGGAIFSQKQSNITISNSSFTSNQATNCNSGLCFGGSLFVYELTPPCWSAILLEKLLLLIHPLALFSRKTTAPAVAVLFRTVLYTEDATRCISSVNRLRSLSP